MNGSICQLSFMSERRPGFTAKYKKGFCFGWGSGK